VKKHMIFLTYGMFLVLFLTFSIPGNAADLSPLKARGDTLAPQDVVILASEMDARFSKDFSPLLKHLRLDWVVFDSANVPETIKDKNIILLGHPENGVVGIVMREILTEDEIQTVLKAEDSYIILEKNSPWDSSRKLYICSGTDYLMRRNAAEVLTRQLVAETARRSDWFLNTYDFDTTEGFSEYVSDLQHQCEDPELPLEELLIDLDAKSPWRISSQQAVEDVERLFYLLSHGYSGYAFFNQNGEFEQAKTKIIQELSSKGSWTRNGLSKLIREKLGFIVDCHLNIEDKGFADHLDFWYDTKLELLPGNDGYFFIENGISFTAFMINDKPPADFLFPSLNQAGEPIYRIGLLSKEKPASLSLIAMGEEGERQFHINLQRSDFDYYAEEVFREDNMGGIPVVRVRGFGDSDPEDLERFVKTATSHRGDPVVIVDIRGNGGGNERWPINWIEGLTGHRAGAVFTVSELESKTSLIGRANAFNYWDQNISGSSLFTSQAKLFTQRAERIEVGQRDSGWTNPDFPALTLIQNDTTVVVVTNNLVASAGEGLVMRISQAENVLFVGENTMGCLTFGNISLHQLPNSNLKVWMPINFSIFQDRVFREEIGLSPDIWVPAQDAVNFTVAALRKGTITTNQPLPEVILAKNFKPESVWRGIFEMPTKSWLLIAALSLVGAIWAFILRKKNQVLLVIGGGWIAFSLYWFNQRSEKFIGVGFFVIGMTWFMWGLVNLYKARIERHQKA